MLLMKERVARTGADPELCTIEGRVEMAFVETRDHHAGSKVDAYRPRVRQLAFRSGDDVVEIRAGSREFQELVETLERIGLMPLHEMIWEAGQPFEHPGADFRIAYRQMSDLAHAEDLFMKGILDDDDEASLEAGWIRFRYTGAFQAAPCSREEYVDIRREFASSRYAVGMDTGAYYGWFRKSERMLDGEAIAAETLQQAERMLEAWKENPDAASVKYWLCRNLGVHPRHRSGFESLVDERFAARTAEAGPTSPTP